MESARRHRRSSARRLVLLALLVALYVLACAAVNVGEAESRLRLLDEDDDDDDDNDDSGSIGDGVGCPNATTLTVYTDKSNSAKTSNTSVQIIDPGFCGKPLIVSARQVEDKDTGESVYELDVRKQGIRRVASIPSVVRILYVVCAVLTCCMI